MNGITEQMMAERDRLQVEYDRLGEVIHSMSVIIDYYGADVPSSPSGPAVGVTIPEEPEPDIEEPSPEVLDEVIASAVDETPTQGNLARDYKTFGERIKDGVVEVLQDGPLHRNKVLELLDARGLSPTGKFPIETLGGYVTYDPRVKKLKNPRGFWALADYEGEGHGQRSKPTEDSIDGSDSTPREVVMNRVEQLLQGRPDGVGVIGLVGQLREEGMKFGTRTPIEAVTAALVRDGRFVVESGMVTLITLSDDEGASG